MNRIAEASLKGTLVAAQSEIAYLKENYAQALERERVLLERMRDQVRVQSLELAREYLRDYYENHAMGVNAVIQSQWARGVHSGRKESLNILDEAIDKARAALAETSPHP